jgi:hypothetical protein
MMIVNKQKSHESRVAFPTDRSFWLGETMGDPWETSKKRHGKWPSRNSGFNFPLNMVDPSHQFFVTVSQYGYRLRLPFELALDNGQALDFEFAY